MLTICTWLWGDKYGVEDVRKLRAGVSRNLTQPHKFKCMVDTYQKAAQIHGGEIDVTSRFDCQELLAHKGCFVRLQMFNPDWQHDQGIKDRLVCIDLDTVITGPLDPLFDRTETFMILQGANASNPCPFNGSLMMLRAGRHPEVWSEFSLEAAAKIAFHEFPDDQGWIHHKLPNAPGWKAGPQSGVYAFQKPGWPKGDDLPTDARMVVFPGWRSPEKFQSLSWIKQHWKS